MVGGPGRVEMAVICLALVVLLFPSLVQAQFPDRPVRILVGFAPGGTSDLVARLIADAAEPALGQRVIVENRAGANGVVAAEAMVRGAMDGTTVFQCATGLMTVTPEVRGPRLPIDPAADMVAIANLANSSLVD